MKLRTGRGREVEVRTTLADRLVSWFDPVRGAERLRSRAFMSLADSGGYNSGRRDRRSMRKWRPAETSANADILPDLPDLRSRSRDLVRNQPIATGALATVITNVVGEGLSVQSTIDRDVLGLGEEEAKAWQRAAQREFALWSTTADFSCRQSFQEMTALVLRSTMESGDLLVVRRWRQDPGEVFATKLQLVEADRISNRHRGTDTATQVAGVTLDSDGVPVAFQVASRHPDDSGSHGGAVRLEWQDVPAWDPATGRPLALLLMERLRPDQVRGVPWLAPTIELFKTLGDYTDAEVRAAVVSAMFTVFVTRPAEDDTAAPVLGTPVEGGGSLSGGSPAAAEAAKEISLEDNGAIVELDPGQEVDIANPGRPNPVFDAFVGAVLRQVGVALELPYELVVKHFTASYSASRAALELAWQVFRRRRIWLARRFCQPVYEWAIEEAVARGRLSAPGFFEDPIRRAAWLKAQWIGPPRISLDPLKDANANRVELENGTTSRAEIILGRGGDPDAMHEQNVAEAKARGAGGLTAAPAAQAARPAPANVAPADAADEPADANDQEDEAT